MEAKDRYFLAALWLLLWPLAALAQPDSLIVTDADIRNGAERMEVYLPLLEGKAVAVVANQTSMVNQTHLVDTLLARKVNLVKVFAPEHGFRGTADAGEHVKNDADAQTGLPLVSLYGSNKKPKPEMLTGIDMIVFDMQDVGARFYTYISTMHYVMEACAEQGIRMMVLDRPNPHGYYVDGPVLNLKYKSFIGMHEVPTIHGMTIGEYAQMLNGERMLAAGRQCDLTVITAEGYNHNLRYQVPVRPSPNLPNMSAINLYPSLCFFEGTEVSVGRGTEFPFQVYGHPDFGGKDFIFTPISRPGAKHPKLRGQDCNGIDLRTFGSEEMASLGRINLQWLIDGYKSAQDKEKFWLSNGFFNLLAGNSILKQQIIDGWTEEEIRKSWADELTAFKAIRAKYLLYPDFEGQPQAPEK